MTELDARRHTVPTSDEPPSRAGWVLDPLLTVRDVVPAANAADRNQIHADLVAAGQAPSGTNPLVVRRVDTQTLEVCTEATAAFYKYGGRRTVIDSGSVLDSAASLATSATLDLLGATDAQVALDPGGEVTLDVSLHYKSPTAGIAAVMTAAMLIDGVAQADSSPRIHTGLGADANTDKVVMFSLRGWAAPGTRTFNVRLTHAGGGTAITVSLVGWTLRA